MEHVHDDETLDLRVDRLNDTKRDGVFEAQTPMIDSDGGHYDLIRNLENGKENPNSANETEKVGKSCLNLSELSSESSNSSQKQLVKSIIEVPGGLTEEPEQKVEDHTNGEAEEYNETHEKLQMIRVNFLRLALRLGQTPHNGIVAQVLYRLELVEQLREKSRGRVAAAFSFDRARAMAEQLEAAGEDPLDFTCTMMVLGKSGVGKSSTINSIFDKVMFGTNTFQLGTKKVQEIVGTVEGIKIRVIDTPGLLTSLSDQRHNEKILRSAKKILGQTPPDIVLYFDRLDMQSQDFSGDMLHLRTITEIFGQSIWFKTIVVLTHAASNPPEATSYDMFVTHRCNVVQQAIREVVGDMRLMNPVTLVENHSSGKKVLSNGQVLKKQLLLLSFATKILVEANTLMNLQNSPPGRRLFAPPTRSRPLLSLISSLFKPIPPRRRPFAPQIRSRHLLTPLSSLLQFRPEVKLPPDDTVHANEFQFYDSDDPSHRYRSNPLLVIVVTVSANGWDHENGFDRVNFQQLFVVKDKIPISLSGKIWEKKDDANLQMEIASSVKHGKGKETSLGFDMQLVGEEEEGIMGYTLRSETRISNHRINKFAAGLSATLLGGYVLIGGMKVEDKLSIGKWGQLNFSGCAMYGRGDVACGGNLNAIFRDKDNPFGRFLSNLGVSVMDRNGDVDVGYNSHTQIPIGRHSNLTGGFNINNKENGKLTFRIKSSEKFLRILWVGLIPVLLKIFGDCR